MSDDDIRILFHRVGDGPPLGIDVNDLMTQGRRVRARRTGLALAGTTLAVATAAAVGLTLGGQPHTPREIQPARPPATSSTTTSTTAPTPAPPQPEHTGPRAAPSSAPNPAPGGDSPPAAPRSGVG